MAPERLKSLIGHPGPILTASMPLDPAEPDATRRAQVAWGSVRREAEELGVPAPVLDEVGERIVEAGRTEDQLVVVADASGIIFSRSTTDAPVGVRYQPAPWFAPVVASLQDQIDHAVVVVDRTGADVVVRRDGREQTQEVGTDAHPIHKAGQGGWSQRRIQERVEQSWRANATEVASTITDLLQDGPVEVVMLGGDERAAALVREELSSDVAARVHPIAATRAPGGDDSAEAKEIERTLADLAARRTVDALRMVRERLDDGGAVEGTEDVLAALRQAQVALLLFSDQPGDDVAFMPDRPDVVGREDLAEVVGAGGDSSESGQVAATRCPVADAAVAAAVATGAEVRLVPGKVGRGSLHALLRWDREPEEGPA